MGSSCKVSTKKSHRLRLRLLPPIIIATILYHLMNSRRSRKVRLRLCDIRATYVYQTIALAIRSFLDSTSSQLTYHGLFALAAKLSPGYLVALFRNSHLSVLYKSPNPEDSALYTLVTDQVFLHETSVVWERLEDVDGGWSTFVDSDFVRSTPAGGDYAGHTGESALAALEGDLGALTLEERAEYVPHYDHKYRKTNQG